MRQVNNTQKQRPLGFGSQQRTSNDAIPSQLKVSSLLQVKKIQSTDTTKSRDKSSKNKQSKLAWGTTADSTEKLTLQGQPAL